MTQTTCYIVSLAPGSPTASFLGPNSYYDDSGTINMLPGTTTVTMSIPNPTWAGAFELYGDALPEGVITGGVAVGVPVLVTHSVPSGDHWLQAVFRESSGSAAPLGTHYCVTIDGTVNACQYGGQNDPTKALTYVITDALIDLVVTAALVATGQLQYLPYVATFLAAIEGTLPFAVDCSVVPATGSPLDLTNPATISRDSIIAWFQQAAWNYFCECTPGPPGTATPTKPVIPPVIPPGGATNVPAALVCDTSDLCTYLNHLETLISQIGSQLSYLRSDVRLIQRQHVPFAYLPGTLHSGLSGSGQFAVSGILGLAVELTTLPPGIGETSDDPIIYFRAGWVATGTGDGWRRSATVSHNPLWIDVQPDDTLVGYTFIAGVIANIQEFVREP